MSSAYKTWEDYSEIAAKRFVETFFSQFPNSVKAALYRPKAFLKECVVHTGPAHPYRHDCSYRRIR